MQKEVERLNDLSLEEFKTVIGSYSWEKLNKLKLYLDDMYYNDENVTEDLRYDIIKDILVEKNPSYVPPVGSKLREGENMVKLPYWLGSADKITPEEENALIRWLEKNPSKHGYIISEKLDGISCLLIHKKGKTSLYTRGNGIEGADISYLAGYFHLPKKLPNIAVRGELILPKAVFEAKYKNKIVNGRSYKNPRNMVAGLTRGKTARVGLEDIQFIVYEIVGDSMPRPEEQMNDLNKLGFRVVKHENAFEIDIDILTNLFLKYKASSLYEIDGLIVECNEPYDRNTSGNPEYMFAFKILSELDIYTSTVLDIEWNVSKWGSLKPVVIMEPVEANGVTISRATAHNAGYVEENSLGPGAVIRVTRSKDVIPYIVEVVEKAEEPKFPDVLYEWDKNHVNIILQGEDKTMCIKLISSFFAKLGIKFVSEATVGKMYNNGLDNLLKIVGASQERLRQVPEFQHRSAERIYTNIREGLKDVRLSTVLGASSVLGYGIASKKVEALLLAIPDLLVIYKNKTKKELLELILSVEGFSHITAEKVIANLKYADKFIEKISKYATFKKETRVSDALVGKKIVMTGFRDKKLEEDITQRGGKVTSAVSAQTSIVVTATAENPSAKVAKARERGVQILTKEEFIERYIL